MKKALFLFIIFYSFSNIKAQTILGEWGMNSLILDAETKEYKIFPIDPEKYHYGNNIIIKPDGTFVSYYTAPCGNDCFTTTTGKYEIIDKTHIRFFLEKITQDGECNGATEPNLDLGVYTIHYGKNEIRFIKTIGLTIEKK